ncbi:MAG: ABC transporter ATP-binding protein [Faecousia sp.]
MNKEENLISVRDLTIHYFTDDGVVKAVNGIDFDINKGETLGLVGETGAGKTTTALGIMQLVPDPPGKIVGGKVIFNGKDLLSESEKEMRHHRGSDFSMIFQDPMTSLNPVITVGEQIAEVVRLHEKLSRADANKKAAEMLELVGIPAERMSDYPHQFSGGMKQRVVIAMALACNPQLIIADEPTTALDVTIQAQVLALMTELRDKFKTAMLLITHDLGVVAEACDKVAIMYAGQIMEYGPIEEIYNRTCHPYTKGLFDSLPSLSNKVHRLNPINGLMPDPANLPSGCPFNPRCPRKCGKCEEEAPKNTEVSPGHFVRCHLYDESSEE